MASRNCKTEAEDSDRYDEGITNRSSAVKFPRFTIIHTARVTMQKHEFSPGRAHCICYWISTRPRFPHLSSRIAIFTRSRKKERKKYELYLGGFLEWRHQIVKPKQSITIGCKPGPKTSSPIANKRKHMHRILGPAIAPSSRERRQWISYLPHAGSDNEEDDKFHDRIGIATRSCFVPPGVMRAPGEEGGWNADSGIHDTFLNYIGTKLATYLTLVQAPKKKPFLIIF